jgi:hypothetical protein
MVVRMLVLKAATRRLMSAARSVSVKAAFWASA